jgi:DNA primase small subunit
VNVPNALNVRRADDFGFSNIMWVYSGRRGVHCWVCDERARVLSDEARAAIVRYLSIVDKPQHGEGSGANESERRAQLPKRLPPVIAYVGVVVM